MLVLTVVLTAEYDQMEETWVCVVRLLWPRSRLSRGSGGRADGQRWHLHVRHRC